VSSNVLAVEDDSSIKLVTNLSRSAARRRNGSLRSTQNLSRPTVWPTLLRQFSVRSDIPAVPYPFPFDCLRFITEYPVMLNRWIRRPLTLLLAILPAPAGFAADDEFYEIAHDEMYMQRAYPLD